ncbi:diaminopimelate decarboxylase family protein [Nocardia sp. CA-107356]|uniref:diaminopimelate decarboxylase family protein n=1 Tax=Nocardia sp. CA-107356 TaxID=3239972 RepID=UPI003D8BB5E5
MTLLDLFSSARSGSAARLDFAIWPRDSHYDAAGRIVVGGVPLAEIADQFGTATRVLDEREVRDRCRAYVRAFPEAEIIYAGQALLVRAVADWVTAEGLSMDVGSSGELAIALAAGVHPKRIILHGYGNPDALQTAVECGVGRIVVGSFAEIDLLAAMTTRPQRVLLRLSPGIDIHGNSTNPPKAGQQYGFPLDAAAAATERIVAQPMLDLIGFHCHLGSQIYNPDYYGEAIRRMVGEMAQIRHDHGRILTDLDLGGGHAIAYRCGDAEMNLTELAAIVEDALDAACARHRFPRPNIALEPGRAIVARAGVTLYRVRSVQRLHNGHNFVVVDGGRCDRPQGPRDGARANMVVVNRYSTGPEVTATVACHTGSAEEILATGVRLPADLRAGEVLAAPCTGAYQYNSAISDHSAPRTPIIAVGKGRCQELGYREDADLLDRDAG